MPFFSPFRYPGGKGRLGAWLAEVIEHNGLSGGYYVEPYAGGAGAAMHLLLSGHVEHVIINDIDPLVHAFWWAVLNDADGLVRLVLDTPVDMDTWNRQRQVLASPERHSATEVGFAAFFLNRTNRSGILRGGVIGGRKQDGPYKLGARYNPAELARRITCIAARRRQITLYREDALELLKALEGELPSKCLIYLDPPYYARGHRLYRNRYTADDHAAIAEMVARLRHPWLVTYDDCEPIRTLYRRFPAVEFCLHYSTHLSRPRATEVLFYGNLELHGPPYLRR